MEPTAPSKTTDPPKSSDDYHNASLKNQTESYKEMIATLPKAESWRSFEQFCKYQGFWCYPSLLEGIILAQEHFMPEPTNILLSSFPKSGMTWLKALSFAIVTRTRFKDCNNPLLSNLPHDIVPFLESKSIGNIDPEIPLLSTHIPYTSLPKSIHNTNCKIIYIWREPKDVLVSTWQFHEKLRDQGVEPISLEEVFNKFLQGCTPYGPYWDHVLGYWKASQEHPDMVLFLNYANVKSEALSFVKKLAAFTGFPFSIKEEKEGVAQTIVNLCSFESLSTLEVNKSKNHGLNGPFKIRNEAYFRKGEVGDWKNYLSNEMATQIDEMTKQKFEGHGLTLNVV